MNYSTKKVVLSGFSILLATLSLSPVARAAEGVSKDYNSIHQQRLAEFDGRNKNFDLKEGFNVHQQRLSEFDSRNKAGNSLSTVPLIQQRYLVLDRNNGK